MNWRDWLYIPKSDKIAIVGLAIAIVILLTIRFVVIKSSSSQEINITIPEDYKEWQAQLTEKKEDEKKIYAEKEEKYYAAYPPKMKAGETIELNSADTTQLKTIPGIGSGYANRIVNYRTALGGFYTIEQLGEVWGMDTYLYSQIVQYLTLNPKHDSIYINKDSFQDLLKHPYLTYKQVMVIEDIRTRKGAIRSLNRLELLDEFRRKDIDRLREYVNFRER